MLSTVPNIKCLSLLNLWYALMLGLSTNIAFRRKIAELHRLQKYAKNHKSIVAKCLY